MVSAQFSPGAAGARVRIWYGLIIFILAIFGVRLFYVQIIRYGHYKEAALTKQLKQYEIPATRGTINAYEGDQIVPIVLNQKLYTLYADPVDVKTYNKNPDKTANQVAAIIGGSASDYKEALTRQHTRYAVLAKKLTQDQYDKIAALKAGGLYMEESDYRTYPQGSMAAQTLGFVNDTGKGEYGIEQALNKQLQGKPGQLKAITDVNGVPLAASKGNTLIEPTPGDNVTLTLDISMQKQLEDILARDVQIDNAKAGNAVIMDIHTGAIKAIGNYPSYDPANYDKVDDPSVFNNGAVSNAIEIGSIMKLLTTSAAFDQGVIQPDSSYDDPGFWKVDGWDITNVDSKYVSAHRTITDILNLSLNTGATWELMQMGGGQINQKARTVWYDYMKNHYLFGQPTGIAQGYEAPGYVPKPADNGAGINLTYANTTFGQAMTATPVQMAAALSSVLNGGTYYKPYLVSQTVKADGSKTTTQPKVLKQDVVSPKVGDELLPIMEYMIAHHTFSRKFDQDKYIVGGKTGTAQIALPTGGYDPDYFNGTYAGVVGGDKPQYVIVVFVTKPQVKGYAGAGAAQPVFGDLAHMLIDNSFVMPKS